MDQARHLPDILIFKASTRSHVGRPPRDGTEMTRFRSSPFFTSRSIHADEEVLRKWYVHRFLTLRENAAFRDPISYFHRDRHDKQDQYAVSDLDGINRKPTSTPLTRQRATDPEEGSSIRCRKLRGQSGAARLRLAEPQGPGSRRSPAGPACRTCSCRCVERGFFLPARDQIGFARNGFPNAIRSPAPTLFARAAS